MSISEFARNEEEGDDRQREIDRLVNLFQVQQEEYMRRTAGQDGRTARQDEARDPAAGQQDEGRAEPDDETSADVMRKVIEKYAPSLKKYLTPSGDLQDTDGTATLEERLAANQLALRLLAAQLRLDRATNATMKATIESHTRVIETMRAIIGGLELRIATLEEDVEDLS